MKKQRDLMKSLKLIQLITQRHCIQQLVLLIFLMRLKAMKAVTMIQKESQKITKKKDEEEKGATNKVFDGLVERNFSLALW